jgi:hypothetical protein
MGKNATIQAQIVDPDDDEGCDGDDGRHLQHDRVGEEGQLDPFGLAE